MTTYYPLADDTFIPMRSEDEKALQEFRRKRNEHWLRMRKAKEQFLKDVTAADCSGTFDFWQYLEVNYGLIPHKDRNGDITEGYDIVNEKLYTLFLLKFSQ